MISVIVPVYNVEEYLEECLESIQHQTYTDIEVILVNDGSTDTSKEICERFCKVDSRFRLINQENQGQSVARNRGFKESVGQYIMFVDSDDVINTNVLEVLLPYMKTDVDMVECRLTINKEEFNLTKPSTIAFEGNPKEAILNCIAIKEVKFCAFTKLYRREIVEKIPFLEGYIYEDVFTGINYLKYIRKIIVVDFIGYYYRIRPNSTMTKPFNEKDLDIFKVGNQLIDSFKDDENMLPYIGYFMFYIGHVHYLKDGINTKSPYVDLYEDFIRKAAFIAKQSKEVIQKYRLLRLYLLAPKYYTTITYPLYKSLQKRWISTKKVMNHLNDKLHIGKN
ncbi:glycosyltransferase family 2 protein [Streptococcus sp. SM3]|uniref:glycosyltransferase family 2 protein n=1 Tax=Streptococcus sp. SM3 TaxID=2898231 RepID=UPI0022B7D15B|nr:glycosyltransferase family 2 protein [Streptococcus sp. SM3]